MNTDVDLSYLGKSTGAGSLGLWMHHLKDIEIIDYSDAHYTGKAIKIGAGVQAGEAADAADAQGLVAIGGNSPTVGIAGMIETLAKTLQKLIL